MLNVKINRERVFKPGIGGRISLDFTTEGYLSIYQDEKCCVFKKKITDLTSLLISDKGYRISLRIKDDYK